MATAKWTHTLARAALAVVLAGWTAGCIDELIPPVCRDDGEAACEQDEDPAECICNAIYAPVCGEDGKTYGNACEAKCQDVAVSREGECEPADDASEPASDAAGAAMDAGAASSDAGAQGTDAGTPVLDAGAPLLDAASCICPALYKPVCGADGRTYGNACEAACAKVSVAREGECKDASAGIGSCRSACPRGHFCNPSSQQCEPEPECTIACLVYDPVCGSDGKTYGCGEADARCHGVEVAYDGECRKEPCACTKEYRPVCGVDGVTYGNRCMAGCAGVAIAREGSCDAPAGTCSYEGKTYRAGQSFPSSDGCNTCSCTDGGLVACTLRACVCDYDAPGRRWVARSAQQCQLVKFACEVGQRPFFNDCGCGCEAEPTCRVGGCSGQLCVGPGDPDVSTCEWREAYACYRTATCAPQASGRCGWTQTDELRRCLEAASR